MKKSDVTHASQFRRKQVGLLLLFLMIVCTVFFVYDGLNGSGPLTKNKIVIVPKGSDLRGIADKLKDEGVVGSKWLFMLSVRFGKAHRELRAGEYLFSPGVSVREVVALLHSGQQINRRLTIAEGLNVFQVMQILNQTGGLVGKVSTLPKEGELLPDTYYFAFGSTRQSVIDQMKLQMNKQLSILWNSRASGLPIKTKREAIILASIVEKEAGFAAERARIAGVFFNRLNMGMRLESDPTVRYAVSGGKQKLGRGLKKSELRYDHPFNTYRNHGLPPGPICNPGKASIKAVLNPEKTSALFFVANGSGGHTFSKTLREHLKAVRKWRQIERSFRRREKEAK